jgi:hypothetical protein
MTTRRGFLATVLTLAAAPAIVRASSLMPVRMLEPGYDLAALRKARSLLNARWAIGDVFTVSGYPGQWVVASISERRDSIGGVSPWSCIEVSRDDPTLNAIGLRLPSREWPGHAP